MTTFTVNTTLDEMDGSIFDGDISLRDAINAAAAGDVIVFDPNVFFAGNGGIAVPAARINLDASLGALQIDVDLLIDGDVDGNGSPDVGIDGQDQTGLFSVTGTNTDAVFNGLLLTDGNALNGGAIVTRASNGSLTVANSYISSNQAGFGGAIWSSIDTTIVNSLFGLNSARGGGAVQLSNGGTIVNSTFFRNDADDFGGGAIYSGAGTVNLINSTLTGNYAATQGGGVRVDSLNIANSIILGNRAGTDDDVDASTLTSNGHNIFGLATTGTAGGDQLVSIANMVQVFESVGPVTVGGTTFDAGETTEGQGIVPSIGIVRGGLANDTGDNSDVPSEQDLGFDVDRDGTVETAPLQIDTNGFNRIVDGTVDIGASENTGGLWLVDTTSDVDDGIVSTGNLSLREALRLANDGDTVRFDGTVFTADTDERTNTTIAVTNGSLSITNGRNVTIDGDVDGDNIADVTLDGSGNGTAHILSLATGSGLAVESLTLQGARTGGISGGAIHSEGTLSVLDSTFYDNRLGVTYGGAIHIESGTATIAHSTFLDNNALNGGAIRNDGDLTVFNSTFVGNSATDYSALFYQGFGGAIDSRGGSLTVTNSTFTGNTGTHGVGGINSGGGGTLNLVNSILVGNFRTYDRTAWDVSAISGVSSNGGNVFGVTSAYATGDVVNAAAQAVFEDYTTTFGSGVLGDNGGPTDTVLLRLGGAAQDQGLSLDVPSEASLGLDVDGDDTRSATPIDMDQRGSARDVGASVDAGAVELDRSLIIVTTTEDTRDGDTSLDDISWREALDLVIDGGRIEFDPNVFTVDDDPLSNTIISVFGAGEKGVTKSFHMDGDIDNDGIADVTFNGGGDEWMEIDAGGGLVTLEGLTFRSFSDTTESGGVLRSSSDLFVLNSNFTTNVTTGFGGALRLYGGTSVVANSYFGDNGADNDGGAIRTTADTTIVGTTFSRNFNSFPGGSGGAIAQDGGTLDIINSTITGNYGGTGGGIHRSGGTLTIRNSIVAGNDAGVGVDDVSVGFFGTFATNNTNIFGAGTASSGTDLILGSGTELSDIFDRTGTISAGGNTMQAGLVTTSGTENPSVSLNIVNSANPALDAALAQDLNESVLGIDLNFDGDTLDLVAFDGRGFARSVDLPGIGTQTADIGAFEVQATPTAGADFLIGDSGHNTLSSFGGGDSLLGDSGNDVLFAGSGNDRASGGADNDRIDGAAGDDILSGVGGNDTINGGNGDDKITGGTGENTLRGQGDADSITGASGYDQILGGVGNDMLFGGGGADIMLGQGNADTLFGGSGNDELRGGSGGDTLDGGGNDDQLFGQGNNDVLIGNSGNDELIGAAGSDSLSGGHGEDDLFGGNGSDTLEGGAGNDLVNGGGQADRIIFNSGDGNDTVVGFMDNQDTLQLDMTLTGTSDVGVFLASGMVKQVGGSVVIDFGTGTDFIRINSFTLTDLSNDIDIV